MIIDELNGSGRCPSTGESAARAARAMDNILADLRAASKLSDLPQGANFLAKYWIEATFHLLLWVCD
jgi:hypothetical protein